MTADCDDYNFWDDFEKSILVAYAAVRERVAAGGKPWIPPSTNDGAARGAARTNAKIRTR